MTSPQTKNGHIQIATGGVDNDVFSALIHARLSGVEYQIVLLVIRKTWGYKKKEDWISLTQFQEETGAKRSYICRAIRRLVTCGILVTRKSPQQTFYSFNKLFSEWVVTPKSLVTSTSLPSDVQDNGVVTPTSHTKETITKEKIQKKSSPTVKTANAGVDAIMKAMEECYGTLDDSRQRNRNYAWLLLKKADMKVEPCIALIRAAAKHDFWGTKITKVEHLYRNAHRIANDLKTQSKSGYVFIS